MNINFNVPDDIGNTFLSSSRLVINHPEWQDDKIVNKRLKQFIESSIYDYNTGLALNADKANLTNLQNQELELFKTIQEKRHLLEEKKLALVIVPVQIAD